MAAPHALAARLAAFSAVSLGTAAEEATGEARSEAERILALPTWDEDAFALDLTDTYKKPKGTMRLRPIQSKVLHAAEEGRESLMGVLGHVGAGGGKTLLGMLLPKALKARNPVLILPSPLVENFHREYRKFFPHWQVADNLKVVTFAQLSVAAGADLLMALHADLIIVDEAHNLARPDAARTKRFLRYFKQFPNTICVPMSGTLTKRSLAEYAHFSELALRHQSPLPLNKRDLLSWGNCIDANGKPKAYDWFQMFGMLPDGWEEMPEDERKKETRALFRARLRSTRGVVCSAESEAGMGLRFVERSTPVSAPVKEALDDLEATWDRPDGESLATALEVAAVASQLENGFYYKWDWPNGEVDQEWMDARKAWHKAIRDILKRGAADFDSPLRVANGLRSGALVDSYALHMFQRWKEVSHRKQPPTVPVWLDDHILQDAVAWAIDCLDAKETGIIWYEHSAVGSRLRALGVPTYGRQEFIPEDVGKAPPVIAASLRVHGTGKNLQYNFRNNLVLSWQGMGARMEQLVARTHRDGQEADEVRFDYYAATKHARNALRKAERDAVYAEDSHGMKQKLLLGTWQNASWRGEDEVVEFPKEQE